MNLIIEQMCWAADGETRSGDAVVVRREGERALVAVIDALGHGARAADVADTATEHLSQRALSDDAGEVMQSLHESLRGTRGAAATILVFSGESLSGCGVGNVELRAQGTPVPVSLNAGILGQHVRQMRVFAAELRPGDRLACFSDGLSATADLEGYRRRPAGEACRALFSRYRKKHDDATLVIVDIETDGGQSKEPRARTAAEAEP